MILSNIQSNQTFASEYYQELQDQLYKELTGDTEIDILLDNPTDIEFKRDKPYLFY